MDIVNQMIEGIKPEAAATDPNDIVNTMVNQTIASEDKNPETIAEKTPDQIKAEEESARLVAEEKVAKEKKAVKEKEKAEKKEIQLDDNGQPKLDDLGTKAPKDAEPIEADWYETKIPNAGNPEAKIQDEAKQKEITDKLTRLAELEKTLADPEVEAFAAAKKQGKGIKEFYNEIVGTDYDSLSPESLQEIKLKRLGVEGEDLAEAMEAFASLPKWDKVERTDAFRSELKSKQSENLKKFSVDARAQEQLRQESINKQLQEADVFAKQLVGQTKFGIEITPSIAHDVKQAVTEGVKDFFKEDGSLNLDNFADAVILYKHSKSIVAANVKKALNKGKGEILAEVTRASKNETVNRVPDEKTGNKTEYDKVQAEFFGQYAKK